jgi:hypothetical protein
MIAEMQVIVDVVAEVTEIQFSDIASSSKREDVVIARKLFVQFATKRGIPISMIAKEIHKTSASVRQLNTKDYRKIFDIFAQRIKTKLANKNVA